MNGSDRQAGVGLSSVRSARGRGVSIAELGELLGRSPDEILALLKESSDSECGTPAATQSRSKRSRISASQVRKVLSRVGFAYAPQSICFVNLKGGIGKTTATITVGVRAAQYGFRTCILDLDSQASASLAFDQIVESDDPIFIDVWQNPDRFIPAALREVRESLFLLPSALENGLLDSSLASPVSQRNAVRSVCEVLRHKGFEIILIDCPPSLGAAVISSICAADTVVIPVGSDVFSFRGLELTLGEVRTICQTFGLREPELRVLLARFDRRERASFEALSKLRERYHQYFLPTVIRTSTEVPRALASSGTVFDTSEPGAPIRSDYEIAVRELLGLGSLKVRHESAWSGFVADVPH